jgi:hypothetical protein
MAALSLEEADFTQILPHTGVLSLSSFQQPFSLSNHVADSISEQLLSSDDQEWAYRLGNCSSSELHVHLMKHILLNSSVGVEFARMLQAFLIGRFDCLKETQPERAVALMLPEVELLLDRNCDVLYVRHWDPRFIVELCRGLPNCLIPAVMRKLHEDPADYGNVYSELLEAAATAGDAEQLETLLQDGRFRRQERQFIFNVNPQHAEAALACIRALLANEELKPDLIGWALKSEYHYKTYYADTCLKIRQLLLDDPRTTSEMISIAFLRQAYTCQEVFELQLLNHPKADVQKLLIKASSFMYRNDPCFSHILKALLSDPRLPDDTPGEALCYAAQHGNWRILPQLLADHRIGLSAILSARMRMPADVDKFDFYRETKATLDSALVARCVGPAFVGIGLAALWMMRCR